MESTQHRFHINSRSRLPNTQTPVFGSLISLSSARDAECWLCKHTKIIIFCRFGVKAFARLLPRKKSENESQSGNWFVHVDKMSVVTSSSASTYLITNSVNRRKVSHCLLQQTFPFDVPGRIEIWCQMWYGCEKKRAALNQQLTSSKFRPEFPPEHKNETT